MSDKSETTLDKAALRLAAAAHEVACNFDELMEKQDLYPDQYAEDREELINSIEEVEECLMINH